MRVAEQQQVIANLVTVDSEQRLGKTPLQLARALGKKDQQRTRIELKIRMKSCPRWSARRGRGSVCLCSAFVTSA